MTRCGALAAPAALTTRSLADRRIGVVIRKLPSWRSVAEATVRQEWLPAVVDRSSSLWPGRAGDAAPLIVTVLP